MDELGGRRVERRARALDLRHERGDAGRACRHERSVEALAGARRLDRPHREVGRTERGRRRERGRRIAQVERLEIAARGVEPSDSTARRIATRRACRALRRSPSASSVAIAASSPRSERSRSRAASATSASATRIRARASGSADRTRAPHARGARAPGRARRAGHRDPSKRERGRVVAQRHPVERAEGSPAASARAAAVSDQSMRAWTVVDLRGACNASARRARRSAGAAGRPRRPTARLRRELRQSSGIATNAAGNGASKVSRKEEQ